ncbi:MAG: DM13 domain-containing protein [Pseudomonadota bacterium]
MRFSTFATAAVLAVSAFSIAAPSAIAQTEIAATASTEASLPAGSFVRKSKKLQGSWEVVERDGQTFIRFDDNFRAARGPDLKVFLSPTSIADVTGDTAINGSVLLGELTSTKGGQEYLVPAGVSVSDFESVLVHCEAYAVLWGGGAL